MGLFTLAKLIWFVLNTCSDHIFFSSLFQELNNICEPIVTQPKPKVDSPKEENPLNEQGDYKTEDMGEDDKNSDMPQQNGECHPGDQNTVNMDLD